MLDDDTPATFGDRAKHHWVSVVDAAHDKIGHKINARKMEHVTELLETFERDLAPHVAPYLTALIENEALPAPLRELLAEVSKPTNLTSSLIVGIGVGSILGPAISAAFAPVLDEIEDQVWSKAPGRELTPELAATAVLKGVMTPDAAAAEVLTDGINRSRFNIMVETLGNAIGIGEALLLWRRGEITDDHLTEIMRYSNLNPKFYEDVRKLRYAPPGTGTVLAGAVQGHLSEAEARDKYQDAGGNPVNYQWQYEATGRPPGTEQMLALMNRRLMTEADVRAGVRESDIKNKYIDAIIDSAVYRPPPRSIVPMMRHGAVSEAEGRELLRDYGVTAEMADAFVLESQHSAEGSARGLTQSQILRMYEAHFIDRGAANARLVALKYPAAEITMLLDFADEARTERFMGAAISKVHTLYVAHKIAKPAATSALTAIGLNGAQVGDVFRIWDIERDTAAPGLTTAQWQGSLRRGLVSHAQFTTAMTQHGYDANEAEILAALAFPPPAAPKAAKDANLTVSQLVKLFQEGGITAAQLRTRLENLGYDATEANEIVVLSPTNLTVAQLTKLYSAGTITLDLFRARLASMGYDAADVNRLVSLAPQPGA